MSETRNCVCRHPNRHILISLLFLLVSSLTHYTIPMAQGRSISGLIQAQQKSSGEVVMGEKIGRQTRQIGSRPPRCERRCSGCARCEAVQVPVAPQHRFHMQFISKTNSISSNNNNNNNNNVGTKYVYPLGGDDFSNYKPMSWKCKCGNFLFNP